MKYPYLGDDKSKTIKKVDRLIDGYLITYLDNSYSAVSYSDAEGLKALKETMLEQAMMKQASVDRVAMENYKSNLLFGGFSSLLCFLVSSHNDNIPVSILGVLCFLYCAVQYISFAKEQWELEKYRMFLNMYNDLDKVNTAEYQRLLDHELIYAKHLDILTVDDYSLWEMKTLYLKYEEEKTKHLD